MQLQVAFTMDLENKDDLIKPHHVKEWLEFELGKVGHMSNSNPLCDEEITAQRVAFKMA